MAIDFTMYMTQIARHAIEAFKPDGATRAATGLGLL